MVKKITIRIVDEAQSRQPNLAKRVAYISMIYGILFGLGVWANSSAMQWAGFVLIICFLLLAVYVSTQDSLSIDEARKKLDDLEINT